MKEGGPVAAGRPETRSYAWVAAPITAFALFALTAGILSAHDPPSKGYFQLFFSDPIHMKAGFATAAAILGCFQLFTAAWIFRKLPWRKPGRTARLSFRARAAAPVTR